MFLIVNQDLLITFIQNHVGKDGIRTDLFQSRSIRLRYLVTSLIGLNAGALLQTSFLSVLARSKVLHFHFNSLVSPGRFIDVIYSDLH